MQYIKAFQKSQSAFTKFYLSSKFGEKYDFIIYVQLRYAFIIKCSKDTYCLKLIKNLLIIKILFNNPQIYEKANSLL